MTVILASLRRDSRHDPGVEAAKSKKSIIAIRLVTRACSN